MSYNPIISPATNRLIKGLGCTNGMRMSQRSVNRRFKRKLTKGQLQANIDSRAVSRHMRAYSMMKKYGRGGDPDYPIPPYPRLEECVTERIERHFNVNEWPCLAT